jgi:hypothetical protein
MAQNGQLEKGSQRPMKIRSKKLTTCRVAADGTAVGLEFLDDAGDTVDVEFPLDQAEAVVMTIPHLLARAVKRQTGNDDARYVFGLQGWRIERTNDEKCLVATLTTLNGFEVCFAIPFEACNALGWHLIQDADQAVEANDADKEAIVSARGKLN